jgi:hypothetical protein
VRTERIGAVELDRDFAGELRIEAPAPIDGGEPRRR